MFNYIKRLSVVFGVLTSASYAGDGDIDRAQAQFENDAKTYAAFSIERGARDINAILREAAAMLKEKKGIENPVALTLENAWNAEVHKAYDPMAYISFAILKQKVAAKKDQDFNVNFWRFSVQRDFRDPNTLVYVKEDVYIDHAHKKVIFLGVPFTQADLDFFGPYEGLTLENVAPLFNVEHGIVLIDDKPHDTWRIVRKPENEAPIIMHNLRRALQNKDKVAASIVSIYGEEMRRMLLK